MEKSKGEGQEIILDLMVLRSRCRGDSTVYMYRLNCYVKNIQFTSNRESIAISAIAQTQIQVWIQSCLVPIPKTPFHHYKMLNNMTGDL